MSWLDPQKDGTQSLDFLRKNDLILGGVIKRPTPHVHPKDCEAVSSALAIAKVIMCSVAFEQEKNEILLEKCLSAFLTVP